MVAMPIPECDPAEIHKLLMERYSIEIPVFKWQDHCIARVSVQGYNSQAADGCADRRPQRAAGARQAEPVRQHG